METYDFPRKVNHNSRFLAIHFHLKVISLSFQLGYDSLVARCRLPHLYTYLGAKRQIHVHTRAELYEAQMLVYITFLALLGIRDDAARHGAGNLAT